MLSTSAALAQRLRGLAGRQEGVRPGQRLLALSDPIRGADMWPITPSTSSLSRVRDAFKLRRAPTVDLVLSVASVEDQLEGAQAGSATSNPNPASQPLGEALGGGLSSGNGAGPSTGTAAGSSGASAGEWRGASGEVVLP